LQELGLLAGTVPFAAGLVGLVGLPGRLLLPLFGNQVRPSFVIAAIFFMLTLSVLTLSEVLLPSMDEPWRLYLYVGLFRGSFGAVLPLRAMITAVS
jgi:hypothetical protein